MNDVLRPHLRLRSHAIAAGTSPEGYLGDGQLGDGFVELDELKFL